jgi:hypothetical protein
MTDVTLQLPSGSNTPTDVILSDGTLIHPDSSGQISVASSYVPSLLSAGWQIVVSSGTTHVP